MSRSPLIFFGRANEDPLNLLSHVPRYGVQDVISECLRSGVIPIHVIVEIEGQSFAYTSAFQILALHPPAILSF
jgi:hypothetical protein